jgi:hypothetical protein
LCSSPTRAHSQQVKHNTFHFCWVPRLNSAPQLARCVAATLLLCLMAQIPLLCGPVFAGLLFAVHQAAPRRFHAQ